MRSIGKYDLLETIAGGAVEVFLAEEIGTRLRRLVCIVRAKDDPTPPSTRDILQAFRKLAPDPPGVILDSGKDQASRSLYLVTSFPADPLAIQTWVQAYRAFTEKRTGAAPSEPDVTQGWTAEAPVNPPVVRERPKPSRTPPAAPPEKPVGEFTRLFHESGPKEAVQPQNPRVTEQVSTSRSEIDELLSSPSPRAGDKPANSPGSFTREFFAAQPDRPAPNSPPAPHGKTGEFTKFFRGGMGAPPEPPPPVVRESFPAPSPGKREGEFTRMFNTPSEPMPKAASEPGFTPVFDRGVMPQAPPSPRIPEPELPPRRSDFAPKFEATNVEPRPQNPAPAVPPSAGLRPMWESEEKSEPSRVFSPPPREPVNHPVVPAGPSDFTRIISGGQRNAPPPPVAAPPAPPAPVAFAPPAPPAVAMPQAPAVPQAPAMPQPPAAPQLAFPAPAAPQAAPPAGKPASYLPLIIVLNVVIIAAVALILYFALKPH